MIHHNAPPCQYGKFKEEMKLPKFGSVSQMLLLVHPCSIHCAYASQPAECRRPRCNDISSSSSSSCPGRPTVSCAHSPGNLSKGTPLQLTTRTSWLLCCGGFCNRRRRCHDLPAAEDELLPTREGAEKSKSS